MQLGLSDAAAGEGCAWGRAEPTSQPGRQGLCSECRRRAKQTCRRRPYLGVGDDGRNADPDAGPSFLPAHQVRLTDIEATPEASLRNLNFSVTLQLTFYKPKHTIVESDPSITPDLFSNSTSNTFIYSTFYKRKHHCTNVNTPMYKRKRRRTIVPSDI
jgi:hypothetical protein